MPSTPDENRRHRYKLEPVDWKALLMPFDGNCWICRKSEAVCVDHDHACCPDVRLGPTCGECVRGALCLSCNLGLGWYEAKRPPVMPPSIKKYHDNVIDYLGLDSGWTQSGSPAQGDQA